MLQLKAKNEKIGSLEPGKLHYLSVSFIDDVEFGKARLLCELTDHWLDKTIQVPGFKFKAEAPKITEAEIAKIPGAAAAVSSVDKIKFEVCVRDGARVIIKPDEDRYWSAQKGALSEEYASLKEDHVKTYEKLLSNIMPGFSGTGASLNGAPGEDDPPGVNETVDPNASEPLVYESVEKLKENESVAEEVASEIPEVTIYRCESGRIFIMAKKDKSLPKHCQLGGFGTGTYVSADDTAEGVAWNVTSDKALVQVDDSTIRQDATSVTTMSLYRLLVTLEKTKRVTEHKLSHLEVSRKQESEDELDGFLVTVRSQQKYKPIPNATGRQEKPSGKNVFSRCIASVESSCWLRVAFRWRYEKVGGCCKVQKPYVILERATSLEKNQPLQAQRRY